jgi:hypothetical protein
MGLQTPMWLYQALGPNGTKCNIPQFRFHIGQPALVRFRNKLPEELSMCTCTAVTGPAIRMAMPPS